MDDKELEVKEPEIKTENAELEEQELENTEISETYEPTEIVDFSDFADSQEYSQEYEQDYRQSERSKSEKSAKTRIPPVLIVLSVLAIAVSVAALIFSISKTNLVIGQGELYVQGGVVNELLGNLIRNDLAENVPENVNVRKITIKVTLYGVDGSEDEDYSLYSKVSDISDSDSVEAEIVFFPQNSVRDFAEDCRKMLDVMSDGEIVYDKILFMGENRSTSITAELSGRFSMNATVEDIMDITFYFIDN